MDGTPAGQPRSGGAVDRSPAVDNRSDTESIC